MRIVIVGLGSIGRRHLKVLKDIGGHQVVALRSLKGTLKEKSGIQEFNTVEDALAFKPDGVIVANPTSLHVSGVLPFLEAGIKALIEKPIAHTAEEAEILRPYEHLIRVAYCMRFLPHSTYFREHLNLEDVYKLSFKRSFYLPKWHPYVDYRKEYTAQKALGGGIIRTLSHEIDLAIFWLGLPKKFTGVMDKISPLEMDVDDYASLSLKMKNNARAHLEMDFFSPFNVNEGELLNRDGKYHWNLKGLFFTDYQRTESEMVLKYDGESFNEIYYTQMYDFLNFIVNGISLNTSFDEGFSINKIISEVEKRSNFN